MKIKDSIFKKLTGAAVASVALFGLAGQAQANCYWIGSVQYIQQDDDGRGGQIATIYVTSQAVASPVYRYFTTDNPHFMDGVVHAYMGGLRVQITGDASSCSGGATIANGGRILILSAGENL